MKPAASPDNWTGDPTIDTPARAGPGLPRDTAQKSENLSPRRPESLGGKSQRNPTHQDRCSMSDVSLRDPTDKRVALDPAQKKDAADA